MFVSCFRMAMYKKYLVVVLLSIYIRTCESVCNVVISENVANRTLCTIPKLLGGHPLNIEIENPAYLYLQITEGGIPRNSFDYVKPIKELWLMGINVTFIQPGAFNNLSTLDSLAVTNTSVTNLSRNTFVGLPNLATNNRISTIEDGAFLELENLQQLILDDNRISRLEEKTFDGLKFLRGLFLNNNPIEYIHDSALQNIKELTHLTISILQGKNVTEDALQLPHVFQLRVFYLTS